MEEVIVVSQIHCVYKRAKYSVFSGKLLRVHKVGAPLLRMVGLWHKKFQTREVAHIACNHSKNPNIDTHNNAKCVFCMTRSAVMCKENKYRQDDSCLCKIHSYRATQVNQNIHVSPLPWCQNECSCGSQFLNLHVDTVRSRTLPPYFCSTANSSVASFLFQEKQMR